MGRRRSAFRHIAFANARLMASPGERARLGPPYQTAETKSIPQVSPFLLTHLVLLSVYRNPGGGWSAGFARYLPDPSADPVGQSMPYSRQIKRDRKIVLCRYR